MKANITRGNSVTDNYQITVEDCIIGALRLVNEILATHRAIQVSKPRPNFAPGGMAIVGESGPEIITLRRGTPVFSHQESAKIITARRWRNMGVDRIKVDLCSRRGDL